MDDLNPNAAPEGRPGGLICVLGCAPFCRGRARHRSRALAKAILRVHDPEGRPLIREGLIRMGRRDLIGGTPSHLVPAHDKG
ncbi:MAG: hypothetical protein CO108_17765, partial [Deltaproteobacteria bacterium CG_4_9_14_3_um_filter_63_12]